MTIGIAIMLVLGSGLSHAVWNLFTKSSRNKQVFLWLIHICASIVFLPFLVRDIARGIPLEGYGFMLITLVSQMGYAYLLPIAYERADMSRAYPIMRGIGALLVPVIGVWLYREELSVIGWAGVSAIVIGLFCIGNVKRMRDTNFMYSIVPILGVGLMITCYTLNDKTLLHYLSPLSLIEVSNLGFALILMRQALRSKEIHEEWKLQWHKIILGAVLSPGSYIFFLYAMDMGPVSHLAPIREISTVFGTLFGVWLLKEQEGLRRILYAGVITSGIIAIGIWGSAV